MLNKFFIRSSYLSIYLIIKWLWNLIEFFIMNSLLDIRRTISCRKSARYLMHPTHVNCIILYIYIYIYTQQYIQVIYFSIKLFCELKINSRANVLDHVLADLPLIVTYVQDVLEIRACVENLNCMCIFLAQRRVRVYFHYIP